MKQLQYIYIISLMVILSVSCVDDNFIDTGIANGDHKTTMWKYFETDPYNWDSLRVMAKHAKIQNIFEGTSSYGKDITFFGITNHSINRYLFQNGMDKVTDIPADDCKKMILSCILNKRILLNEFVAGIPPASDGKEKVGVGGKIYKTLAGTDLWIYTFRESYNEVPKTGAVKIKLVYVYTNQYGDQIAQKGRVASSNIKTQTGIVHSLSYNHTLSDFFK